MLCALSLKHDVLSNDFSDFNCEVSRETTTSTVWKIAIDLNHKVGAMDMCIPTEFTDTVAKTVTQAIVIFFAAVEAIVTPLIYSHNVDLNRSVREQCSNAKR